MKLGMQIRSVVSIDDCVELTQLAERKGYDSVWFSEGYGHNDAISTLTAAARSTSRITLGTSVLVVYLRHPILTGMTSMALAETAKGRFVLGLGTGHRDQLAQYYGLSQERPVRYMREYVDVVRLALEGKESDYTGEIFEIHDYHRRTTYAPPGHVPVFLGVLNENMLRLAGRTADGVLLAFAPKSHIRQARAWVAEGAIQAGRDPSEITIGAIVPAAVSDDGVTAEDALRQRIAAYASFPDHDRMLRASGHGQSLDSVREALAQRDWAAVGRGLSDEIVAEIGMAGTPAACRAAAASYEQTGLDLLVVIPTPIANRSETQHHGDVIEAFGA
jgi:alkanesulfonate monooxygenase SsuD/methylene tetrahydromethanopterin reductase-like flavin-dependent oxidoreductase (luciferase family)